MLALQIVKEMVHYHIIHPDDSASMLSWLTVAVGKLLVAKQAFDAHSLESLQRHAQHTGTDEDDD